MANIKQRERDGLCTQDSYLKPTGMAQPSLSVSLSFLALENKPRGNIY